MSTSSSRSVSERLESGKRKIKPLVSQKDKVPSLQLHTGYGIPNYGNTCYLNSFFQVFLNNKHLIDYVTNIERLTINHDSGKRAHEIDDGSMVGQLMPVIFSYINQPNEKNFKECFDQFFDNFYKLRFCGFEYGEQHDVHELFTNFYSIFDGDVIRPLNFYRRNKGMENLPNMFDQFKISVTETFKCRSCSFERSVGAGDGKFEHSYVPIQVLDVSSTFQGLCNFFSPVEVDTLCEECQNPFLKRIRLNSYGNIIVCQMILFGSIEVSQNYLSDTYKVITNKAITCDSVISFIGGDDYKLCAVIFHEGPTLRQGHYTSLCFHEASRSWNYFDDNKPVVTLTDPLDFIEREFKRTKRLKSPYLAFYSKVLRSPVRDDVESSSDESEVLMPDVNLNETILELSTMETGDIDESSDSSLEVMNSSVPFKTPGKNDSGGDVMYTPDLIVPGINKKPRKKKSNAKARKARERASQALLRSQEERKGKAAADMREKRNSVLYDKTPEIVNNKNYKDKMRANLQRQQDETLRNTRLRKEARETPEYRDFEQKRDTSARQEARLSQAYRESEQTRDTSARQEWRRDAFNRTREQAADTQARRKKRHSIRNLKNCYLSDILEGPIYPCACCGGLFFRRSLKEYNPFERGDDNFKRKVHNDILKYEGKYLACWTCRDHIVDLKIPTLALNNGLNFPIVNPVLGRLNETERITLSPCLLFLRCKELGWDHQKGLKGNVVNVPINVKDTLTKILPRQASETSTVQLNIMRKMDYKNPYKFEKISPYKIMEALKYLQGQEYGIYKTFQVEFSQEWIDQYQYEIENPESQIDYIVEEDDSGAFSGSSSQEEVAPHLPSSQRLNPIPTLEDSGVDSRFLKDLLGTDFFDPSQETVERPFGPFSQLSQVINDLENGSLPNSAANNERSLLFEAIAKRSLQESDGDDDSDIEGKVDYFCSQNRYHKTQSTMLDAGVQIAPGEDSKPEYFLDNPDSEFCHFFDIYGGHIVKYPQKMSYGAICKSQLRRYDRRCAKNILWILYAYKRLIGIKLRKAIETALRQKKVYKDGVYVEATAGVVTDKEKMKDLFQSEEALLFLRAIRSSPQFWEWKKTEMNAMIRQFGTPTFFITISPSEANCFELIVILKKVLYNVDITIDDAKRIPRNERIEMINNDPVTVARYFENRLRLLLKFFFARNGIFKKYPVADFVWRIDFQYRGSPHCHMLVWLNNTPKYENDMEEGTAKQEMLENYANFVDSYISCRRPVDDILVESDDEEEEVVSQDIPNSPTPQSQLIQSDNQTPIRRVSASMQTPLIQRSKSNLRRSQALNRRLQIRERKTLKISFQFHGHRKKNCMCKDSYGNDVCKYNFPRPIMATTKVIEPFIKDTDESRQAFEVHYKRWIRIRDELEVVYQLFLKKGVVIGLDVFLRDYLGGMSVKEYELAISCSIKRVVVFLRRFSHEIMINSYNKIIIMWGSNMDIQEVSDPYGCASYVAAYMLKSNAVMSKLLRMAQTERDENITVRQKLQRLGNKFVNCQEVGAQEAVYTLLAMPVCQSSRDTIYVNTFPSKLRSQVLKDYAILKALNVDSTSIYKKNLLDHYVNRPDKAPNDMSDVCLAEFAAYYNYITPKTRGNVKKGVERPFIDDEVEDQEEDGFDEMFEHRVLMTEKQKDNLADYQMGDTTEEEHEDLANKKDISKYIKLKNNDGYVLRRKTMRILRYKRYNQRNNKKQFFRVQNMLYLPWRNEATELENDSIDQIKRFMENKDLIVRNRANFEHHGIDKIIEAQRETEIIFRNEQDESAEKEVERAQLADRLIRYYNRDEEEDEDQSMTASYLERALASGFTVEELEGEHGFRTHINDRYEFRNYAPDRKIPISVPKRCSDLVYYESLSKFNKLQYLYFINFVRDMKTGKQFLHFIRGGSGTGKSYLIKSIYQTWIRYHQPMLGLKPDEVPPHSELKILVLVGAYTGKAAFAVRGDTIARLFKFRVRAPPQYVPLSNNTRKDLEALYKDVNLIIMDEVSMIGCNLLYKCDLRTRQFKDNDNEFFGGLPVILVGDFNQIAPIGDGGMIYKEPNCRNRAYDTLFDVSIWSKFQMFELTEIMRQTGEEFEFAEALNNIGDHFYYGLTEKQIDMFNSRITPFNEIPDGAIYLYYSRENVRMINTYRLKEAGEGEIITCTGKDGARGKGAQSKSAEVQLKACARPDNQKLVDILLHLPLKVGCKYMVVVNSDVSDGLTNGTTGILKNYVRQAEGFRDDPQNELLDPKRLYFDFLENDVGLSIRQNPQNKEYYNNDRMWNDPEAGVNKNWTLLSYDENVIKDEEDINRDFSIVRIQYQIVPCEGLTIHKCQGQTYMSVAISLDQVLQQTLLYVAMSRVTSLKGLYFFTDEPWKKFVPLKYSKLTAIEKKEKIEELEDDPRRREMARLRNESSMPNKFQFLNEIYALASDVDRLRVRDEMNLIQLRIMVLNIRGFNNLKRRFLCNDPGFMGSDIILLSSCGNRTHNNLPSGRGNVFDFTDLHGNYLAPGQSPFINIFNTHSTLLNHQNGMLCFIKDRRVSSTSSLGNLIEVVYHNADPDNYVFSGGTSDAVEVSMFMFKPHESSSKKLYILFVYRHPGGNVENSFRKLMSELGKAKSKIRDLINSELIIVGDFNFDFNRKENEKKLHEIELVFGVKPMFFGHLENNAKNRVKFPTHDKGNQLDWAFTTLGRDQRCSSTATVYETLPFISDHKPIFLSVTFNYIRPDRV